MKKRMTLQDKAEAAMKKAVRQVVERHKKTGRPLAVWQNGKNEQKVAPSSQRSKIVTTLQPVRAGSRAWIFQTNPLRYGVLKALSNTSLNDGIKCWQINQHGKEIKSGDMAFIWMSGKNSGIYAVAEVISDPEVMKDLPEDDKFWVSDEDKNQARLRVKMKIRGTFLNNPLFRVKIKATPGFENLSILKYFQGTNFPVTRDEYKKLVEMIATNNLSSDLKRDENNNGQ